MTIGFDNSGIPKIGNNVWIGHNSVVLGGIIIEDDVMIAPLTFVNFSVPKNSIVIGNPAKIIKRDESPTKKYMVYPI